MLSKRNTLFYLSAFILLGVTGCKSDEPKYGTVVATNIEFMFLVEEEAEPLINTQKYDQLETLSPVTTVYTEESYFLVIILDFNTNINTGKLENYTPRFNAKIEVDNMNLFETTSWDANIGRQTTNFETNFDGTKKSVTTVTYSVPNGNNIARTYYLAFRFTPVLPEELTRFIVPVDVKYYEHPDYKGEIGIRGGYQDGLLFNIPIRGKE